MKGPVVGTLVLSVLLLVLTLSYGRVIIDGDGLSYYALTLSLTQDRDFDLRNQKQQIQGVMAPFNETTGKPASLFSCGFGVLYAPALWTFERFQSLTRLHPYPQNDRIPFPHSLAVFAQSLVFGFGAMLGSYWFVMRKLSLAAAPAAAAVLFVFAGSPILFYTVTMPSYSHAADAFLTMIVFVLVLSDWKSPMRSVLAGFALSLAVLLRNNNVVFWPVAAAALLYAERPGWLRASAGIVAGALPVSIGHALFNLSQYGKVFATGYRVQTETGFLAEMLFHPYAGIFVWAPVTGLGLFGLLMGTVRKRPEAIVSLSAVVLVLLSVQFQPNWWGGCSFGQRFFTHLFFFWVIGLAELCLWRGKRVLVAAGVCAMWTFFLFNAYLVNAGTVEGRSVLNANKCRRTPSEVIASAFVNYERSDASGYFSYWIRCLSARPYPTILFLFTGEKR